jgi:putative ABC transport system permease protein
MRHWSQLATRNWRASTGRTVTSILAVTLGVGLVLAVSCCYESLRVSVTEWVLSWLGRSQIHIEHRVGSAATIDQSVVEQVRRGQGVKVVAPRARFWMTIVKPAFETAEKVPLEGLVPVDCYGIDPSVEYELSGYKLSGGRLLRPGDQDAIVLQLDVAEALRIPLGGRVVLEDGAGRRVGLKLVGTVAMPQLGIFQRGRAYLLLPRLQELNYSEGKIHTADVLLEPEASVNTALADLRRRLPSDLSIDTSESKLRHINDGMRLLNLVLLFNSICALLAAVFVIFSALNMGVIERMTQLGILRCIGATRRQIATMVFIEALPIALVGIALGVGLGIFTSKLAVLWYGTNFGHWHLSVSGLRFAVIGGLAATVVAAAVPAIMASSVSPLTATRPRSVTPPGWLDWLAAGVGLLCGAGQAALAFGPIEPFLGLKLFVLLGFPVLVAGCLLVGPLLIRGLSWLAAVPLAAILRIHRQVLMDQFGRSGWRNATICCAMMVGLAFMVNLLTNTESIIAGWQFPQKFPDALLWSFSSLDDDQIDRARQTPGIAALTPVTTIPVEIAGQDRREASGVWRLFQSKPMVHLVGVDQTTFDRLVELRFLQGQPEQAYRALAEGGAVLVAKEFRNSFGKNVGDHVDISGPGQTMYRLRIVGVVDSPGVDVVTDFFDQRTAYQRRAVGALMTTRSECLRMFGTRLCNLLLFNFDLSVAADEQSRRQQEQATISTMAAGMGLGRSAGLPPAGATEFSFAYFLQQGLGYVSLSARKLKLLIEQDFRQGILWLVFAAGIAVVVGALGVGNGMMANIASRARQMATLRALGMTRSQLVRMVLAEALSLGIMGAFFGVLLGLYLAGVSNHLDYRLFGFEPILRIPWNWIAAGVCLTVGASLAAGLIPIISAARSNVVEALRSS